MINTLFYFVDDPTFNYQAAVNNGDISEYTVVFNSADKCIYAKNTVFSKVTRVDVANTLGDISDILPAATSSKLGGVKIGYSSDDKRYGLKLDSNNRAYVEVPWTDTIAPAYDDTGILDDLDAQRQRIDQYINNLTTTIKEYNETLFDDAQWVVNNLTAGQVGRQINENIDEYFRQQYGVWDWVDPNDHTKGKVVRTSVIEQNVDSIDLRVGSVEDYKDGYLTTALSNLEQTVGVDLETGETTAGTNLINSVSQLDADTNNIVKMAASALQLKASKNGNALSSTADLASVIVNGQFTGYSGLNETVSNQGDAITAQSSLMSRVVNSDGTPNATFKADVITGLASTASVTQDIATAKSEVIASANTNIANAVSGLAVASTVTQDIATAKASLLSSVDKVCAGIGVTVTKDANGNYTSVASIDADDINLNGQTTFMTAIGNSIKTNVLEAGDATFTGTINVTGSNSGNAVTINNNGFQAIWGSGSSAEGLKIGSGGLQRYDGVRNTWLPMFNKRNILVNGQSSAMYLDSSVDFFLNTCTTYPESSKRPIYLPSTSDLPEGAIVTIRGVRGAWGDVMPRNASTEKISVSDDNTATVIPMQSADRFDFVLCKHGFSYNTWLCNAYDRDV